MMKLFGIALGAGVTSAVLIAVATTHSLMGILLAQLAPLPIMIAGLGFAPEVGGAAALIGSGAVGVALGPWIGLLFLGFSGLPSWLLARLAGRRRAGRAPAGADAPSSEWMPISTLVLGLVAVACGPVLLAGSLMVWRFGGYDRALAAAAEAATQVLAGRALPGDVSVELLVQVVPVAMAVSSALFLAINLWLAARSVQLSGWLKRPWPNLPDALRLPRSAVGVFAVLCAGIPLPDPFGLAAAVVVGALGMAFVFEGLAAIHVLTRGLSARLAVLAAVYLAVLLVEPWPLLALTVAGCIDCLVPSLRRGAAIKITKLPKRRQ